MNLFRGIDLLLRRLRFFLVLIRFLRFDLLFSARRGRGRIATAVVGTTTAVATTTTVATITAVIAALTR